MIADTEYRQSPTDRRRRPFGVTVIAVIQVVSAIGWGVITFMDRPDYRDLFGSLGYYEIAGPALGVFGLVIAVGLLTLRRQAWVLTMLWAGLNLTAALYGWYYNQPNYIAMVLSVITVYYLNQREVQAAFHVPIARGWHERE